ncbi:hypothetical protein CI109_105056 [Kwoniella shandongensis]|uniref:Uncharacterized protein n=1 Tax=Kwoniella shandongensis TaxID=1734106 RepID=A0A5M6BWS0_9TREE|nr:uncharacterized protein CI109_004344 [Kwoniella shandongensis]KAA5527284.1 hypothetical protein CI109_004344 [Kwoniella shandongensis]
MNTGRTGRRLNEPGGSGTPVQGAPRKARKKPKTSPLPSPQPSPAPRNIGPIPRPYLALAPSPVSALSPSAIDQLTSTSQLVLPSSYLRTSHSPIIDAGGTGTGTGAGPSRPTTANGERTNSGSGAKRSRYAAGLLSPPTIVPGGSSSTPRVQTPQQAPANPRRRSADRDRPGQLTVRRSEERLRDLRQVNPSLSSLGQLGQILESGRLPDTPEEEQRPETTQQRRRRRVVRNEAGGLTRRPTVSSREEGRALGLARGASMRRTNVWDDIPEAGEPPPPFPFPTTSTNRLPPAFPLPVDDRNESDNTPRASSPVNVPPPERPRSPPPTFEQAIGLSPSPHMLTTTSAPPTPQPTTRPTLSLSTTLPAPVSHPTEDADTPTSASTSSPTSSHFVSAPSSPTRTVVTLDDEDLTEEERSDRRMWNADLLAGYSLEERVRREMGRRKTREQLGERRSSKEESSRRGSKAEGSRRGSKADPGPASQAAELTIGGIPEIGKNSQQPPSSEEPALNTALEEDSSTVAVPPTISIAATSQQPQVGETQLAPTEPPTVILTPPMPSQPFGSDSPAEGEEEDSRTPTEELARNPMEAEEQQSSGEVTAQPAPSRLEDKRANQTVFEHTSNAIVEAAVTATDTETSSTKKAIVPAGPPSPKSIPSDPPASRSPLLLDSRSVKETTGIQEESAKPSAVLLPPTDSSVSTSQTVDGSAANVKPVKSIPARRSSATTSPKATLLAPMLGMKRNSEPTIEPTLAKPLFKGGTWGYSPEIDVVARMEGFPGRTTGKPVEADDRKGITKTVSPEVMTGTLPPNREAALKRRDLRTIRTTPIPVAPIEPRPLKSTRPPLQSSLSSGPLIDLNDDGPVSRPSSQYMTLAHLAASSADLLELLEIAEEPVAESSAQAAARSAAAASLTSSTPSAVSTPRLDLRRQPSSDASLEALPSVVQASAESVAESIADSSESVVTKKRVPPPPPPPLKMRSAKEPASSEGDTTPKAISSPSERPRRPTIPTRRPPPPPPPPAVSVDRQTIAPPLPPRPPPPAFTSRPSHIRSDSTGSQTSSSNDTVVPHPEVKSPRFGLGLLGLRPRGPRPPPPPPPRPRKSWVKIVTSDLEEASLTLSPVTGSRPMAERTQSDFPRRTEDEDDDAQEISVASALGVDSMSGGVGGQGEARSLNRSASEVDMRRRGRGPSGGEREYTDLDLLVSRLEGSGREFEGFTQITTFLGPSKPPAASPEAIATLLPALINVDSRRTTPQGKVKLKLSLLGVRVSKCPICLSQFRGGEKAIMIPGCGHSGHEGCVLRWFREDGRCFVCREVLGGEE